MAEDAPYCRDDIIKENLKAFLPYIRDCVKSSDLLMHLHYFTIEQRKEIYELSKRNNTSAMEKAMDILLNRCEDRGRFVAIRDALQNSEYPKIVAMLDGDLVSTDENCRKIIDLFSKEIIHRLDPMDLIANLIREGVITEGDDQEIRAEGINYGTMRGCWVLLFHLPNRDGNWFRKFMEALVECDYSDISEILDPDLHKKIVMRKTDVHESETHPYATLEHVVREDNRDLDLETNEADFDPPAMGEVFSCSTNTVKDNENKEAPSEEYTFCKLIGPNEEFVDSVAGSSSHLKAGSRDMLDTHISSVDKQRDGHKHSKIIRYDRAFLLNCKDSPFTKKFPKEVENFPDINVLLALPRRSDTGERRRFIKTKLGSKGGHSQSKSWTDSASGDLDESSFKMNNNSGSSSNDDVEENPLLEELDTNKEGYFSEDDQGVGIVYNNDFGNIENEDESNTYTEINFDFLLDGTTEVNNVNKMDNGKANQPDQRQRVTGCDGANADQNTFAKSYVDNATINLDQGDGTENDLNKSIATETSGDSQEYNIATDTDSINCEDDDIQLRKYQTELAKEGTEGENVVVLAPTNSGKTVVASRIMQVHLRRRRQSSQLGKVIFLVENESLALQQGKAFVKWLPAYRTKVITGSVQRDKKQMLKDFIDRRDILVVTAQLLLNDLNKKEIESLTRFSMIVFDECHHTDNLHRYNEIMAHYMDLKLRQNIQASDLPQIVGLTASLGVGGASNEEGAIRHMKEVLANLDAKFVCTVRKNIKEMKTYVSDPREEIVTVPNRENDRYRTAILGILGQINTYMSTHDSLSKLPQKDQFIKNTAHVPESFTNEQFLQWLSVFKADVGRVSCKEASRMLDTCRIHLEAYNKALSIHNDSRIKDAEAILEAFMDDETVIERKNETDKFLISLYRGFKTNNFEEEPENPQLLKMQELVMDVLGDDDNARGMIFVKTRELAKALVKWMHETEPLNRLNAFEFVGQVASSAEGGMTKSEQNDVMTDFRSGKYKVLIATSIGEEGLDIPECNLVIRYNHVTNEIARLQARGRARALDSQYYVLSTEGSWVIEKEQRNVILEELMHTVVPKLQSYIEDHPNIWEKELLNIQEEQKCIQEATATSRKENQTRDEVEFRCGICSLFICKSSDIRVIKDNHHVVINKDVNSRLISVRDRTPKFVDDEMQFDGAIFCGNIDCQRELGGVCEYRKVEFPLLKIKLFKIVYNNGESRTYKTWKKANIVLENLSPNDLSTIIYRRRDEM